MKPKDLIKLGYQPGPAIGVAIQIIPDASRALGARALEQELEALIKNPAAYTSTPSLPRSPRPSLPKSPAERPTPSASAPPPTRLWGQNLGSRARSNR